MASVFLLLVSEAVLAIAACSSTDVAPEAAGDASLEGAAADVVSEVPPTRLEAGVRDGGQCTAVRGPCDLVLQDCADDAGVKQECVLAAGNTTTECRAVQASQQLPIGRACCPGTDVNPCLPGLTCVGNACTDAGIPTTGRCSPACCRGDDRICKTSDPEGISGSCDLALVDSETRAPLHDVCTYRQRCKPFGLEACKTGETCLIEDKAGTASCVDSFGKTNRQPCSFANECADGLVCLGGADAGRCRMGCLLPRTTHPFDASVEQGGPGRGGCPSGEQCRLPIQSAPAWFGACAYPDGG